MLRFALIFAILALVAGVCGFGNLAGDFSYLAHSAFCVSRAVRRLLALRTWKSGCLARTAGRAGEPWIKVGFVPADRGISRREYLAWARLARQDDL